MGCGASRTQDSRLVRLCRDRRELLAAAAEHRYRLASAHVAYFRALRRVGDALQRFADEALSPLPHPGSPVLTIPSSEGKRGPGSRSVSSFHGVGVVRSPSPPPPSSFSPVTSISLGEGSHLRFSEDSSHLHLSSEEEVEEERENKRKEAPVASTSTGYYYMRQSTGNPSTVYQSPNYPGQDQYGVAYGHYYGMPMDGGADHSSAPAESMPYPYYDSRHVAMSPAKPRSPPPPPPAPEVSGWDFLDPFGTYEQVYWRYSLGSFGSSSNSSEVREREGIPDLEDETEQENSREALKRRKGKGGRGAGSGRKGHGKGDGYKASTSGRGEDVVDRGLDEKQSKGGRVESECIGSSSSVEVDKPKSSVDEEDLMVKEVKFDVEVPPPEARRSRSSVGTALSTQGTRDIREVVEEIKGLFNVAAVSGEELWSLLEVGKLRYHSRKAALRVLSSRFLIYLRLLTRSRSPLKYSRFSSTKTLKLVKASRGRADRVISSKFGDLSSTIERLNAWEKKLHKEVKIEEKLRIAYDKKFRQLRALDDDGAESDMIDSTRASIRKLLTRIDIIIKSIDAISRRIQKLRDEELQLQISGLISGLRRIWKTLLQCHHKQFQAIIDSKTSNLLGKIADQKSPVAKATMELEAEILHWLSCLVDWVSTQKSYIGALNGWLRMYLNVEPEVTPDGVVPFSPARFGAPAVFITCNDWHQVMDRISGDAVTRSILDFAKRIHELWEKQNEEQQQRLKAEYLSKDYARRLASSDGKTTSVYSNTGASSDDRTVALDWMQKRLDEEKAKHEKALEQVHAEASSSLRAGLIPVFDALCAFSSETLKAYDGIRLPRANGGS